MLVIVFYSISLPDSKKLAAMAMLIQLQPCHVHSRNSHIDKEKVEGNKSFLVTSPPPPPPPPTPHCQASFNKEQDN